MGRRYGRYNRGWNDWEYSSVSSYAKQYPIYKIVCETENHIGFINLPPKKEYRNPKGYALIAEHLYKISKNRISYIQQIEKSGITSYVYRRPKELKPESDMGWKTIIQFRVNKKSALYLFVKGVGRDEFEAYRRFLHTFFTNPEARNHLNITGSQAEHGDGVEKKLLKRKRHERYNSPHKQAQGSPIEKLFREELQRRNINFEEQVEIVLEDKKFSVPDFVIRSANLMIYCDGTEFHKNPQRIIMDKQQDRALQANGFTVFRFSGSEIASNVKSCVDEVDIYLSERAKK